MPWLFRRSEPGTLAVAAGQTAGPSRLPWAHREPASGALRFGVLERDGHSDAELARRWRKSGLARRGVRAVLPLAQTHWLQLPAPAVPAAEWREAARWRLTDLVDTPPAELALDVMPVGADGRLQAAGPPQLFVAATPQQRVQRLQEDAQALGWTLASVGVAETTQRDLQTAVVAAAMGHAGPGDAGLASAALVRHGNQALLTFCVGGELYQTRRLERAASGAAVTRSPQPAQVLESADIVDYGAADELPLDGTGAAVDEPLLRELQRSLDVWERTWPDRPLAGLWLALGDDTEALLPRLRQRLSLPVQLLDPFAVWPAAQADAARHAFEAALQQSAHAAELREACLPLLGALIGDAAR
jgi:MSHA biogenesis protein MshI